MNIPCRRTGSNFLKTSAIAGLLCASLANAASAQVGKERINARIGQRENLKSGERSAILWLARVMKERPQLKFYVVEWSVRIHGVKVGFFLSYDKDDKVLSYTTQRHESIEDKYLSDITATEIYTVARKRGVFANFSRYGAKVS